MSFEEAYNEYLIYASKRHKKQGFVTLQSKLNSCIYPYFKNDNIENITKQDIIKWQNIILDKNYKNSYNESLFIQLSSLFNFFCDFYNLPNNIVKSVKPFSKKFEEKKVDFYTIKEFKLFISNVDDIVYKTFFELLYFTGLRCGEALALTFNDIVNDTLIIYKNLTSKHGRNIDTPKNPSSIRNIKINKFIIKHLKNLYNYYVNLYGVSNKDYFIFGYIKPLAPSTIERRKKEACNKANLRTITIHQFRHSHATLLLQKCVMINEVSKRLGHSKTSTTLDIYCHTNLLQEKRVLKTLHSIHYNIFDTLQSKLLKYCKFLK